MKTFAAFVAAVAITAVSPTTLAQPNTASGADVPKEAENHFRRGLDLYKEGDAGGALVEFKRAYDLAPNFRALYNIGETHFQLQHYAEALKTLQAYLNEGGSQIPADKRAGVENEIRQLEGRIGQIEVKVNVEGAQIFVDDELVGTSPLGQPAIISVGHRKIVVSKTGLPTQERFIDVAAGDRTGVSIDFAPAEPAPTQGTAAPVAPPTDYSERPAARSHAGVWIAWSAAGVFGAATAVTGVLTLTSKKDLSNQLGTFPGNAGAIDDARSKVRTLGIVTDALIGATAVAGVVALYVTLTGHSRAASTEVGVGPSSVVLRGRF
jgi:Tetratricopeptide repeat